MSEPTEKTPKQQFLEAVSKHPAYQGWKAEDVEANVNSVLTGNDVDVKKEFFGALTKLPEYKGWKEPDIESNLSSFWNGAEAPKTSVTAPTANDSYNVPQKYVATIKKAAKEYGIPESTLTELLRQESAFDENIVSGKVQSKKGAKGIAQFMDATAKEIGVDPLNPDEAIPGSAKYLRQLIDQFGDTSLALAAYNSGPGNVKKAGNKIPDIPETQTYVDSITKRANEWGGKTLPEAQDIATDDGYESAARRELNERRSGEADTLLQSTLGEALNPTIAESSSTGVAQPADAKNLAVNDNVMTGDRKPDNGLAEKENIARVNVLNEEFQKMELDPKYAIPLKEIRDSYDAYSKNPTAESKKKFQEQYLANKDLFDYYTGVAADLGSNARSIFPNVPDMVEAGNMEPLKGLSDKEQAKAVAIIAKVKSGTMTVDQAERELDWRGTMAGRLGGATAQGVASTAIGMLGALEVVGIDAGKPLADQIDKFIKYASPEEQNFMEQLASGVGSMATFMVPGLGTEMGISKLAGAAPKLATYFGVAVPTVMEAMTEAGSSFRDDVNKGVDKETARKNALKVFGLNIPLLAVTNKLGVFAEEGGTFKRMVGSAIMEGSQEFGQELAPDLVKGNPSDIERYMMAGAIGGLIGAPAAAIVDNTRGGEHAGNTDKGTELPGGIAEATKNLPSLDELNAEDAVPADEKRKDMPQVKPADVKQYLTDNKIAFKEESVKPDELNAIQKDFKQEKVDAIKKSMEEGKDISPVVVSSDGYIVDGHHRWLAAQELGRNLDIIRIDQERDDALKTVESAAQDQEVQIRKPLIADKAETANKKISDYADVVKEAIGKDAGTSTVNAQRVIALVPELRTADRTKNLETAKKIVDQLKADGVIDDKGKVQKQAAGEPLVNMSGEHREEPKQEDEPITVRKEFTYPQIEQNLDKPFKDYATQIDDVQEKLTIAQDEHKNAITDLRAKQKGLQKKSTAWKELENTIDSHFKKLTEISMEADAAEENLISTEEKFVVDYAKKKGITFQDSEEEENFVQIAIEHFQNFPEVREQYWDTNLKDVLDGVVDRYLGEQEEEKKNSLQMVDGKLTVPKDHLIPGTNVPRFGTFTYMGKYDWQQSAVYQVNLEILASGKNPNGKKLSAQELKNVEDEQKRIDDYFQERAEQGFPDQDNVTDATNITEVGSETIKTAGGKTKDESEKFESTVKAAESEAEAAISTKDPDRIKQAIAAIDDILLGYYTTEGSTEKDDAETGNLMPEKKFKQDLKSYAKKLNSILGWEEDKDKKGKNTTVSTNVAPAGGDGHIILWKPNSEYGIYISIPVQRDYEGENHDNLEIRGILDNAGFGSILYRATTKKNKYTGLGNNYAPKNITAQAFAKIIQDEVAKWDSKTPEQSKKEADKILSESLTAKPATDDDRVVIPKPGEPAIEPRKVPVMREQKKRFGKQLIKLFDSLGLTYKVMHGDPNRDGDMYVKVKNEPYMDLVIEAHDEGRDRWISVAHYRSQNGDTWIETEALFLVGNDGQVKLKETAVAAPNGEHRGYDEPFANIFTTNLLEQGFGSGEMTDMLKKEQEQEAEKVVKNNNPSEAVTLLNRYEEGDDTIATVADLVDAIEALDDDRYSNAIADYRTEEQDDKELGGRGDMDTANENFINAIRSDDANLSAPIENQNKEGEKQRIARKMIKNHPLFNELLKTATRYLRTMYSKDDPTFVRRLKDYDLEPEDLLSAHAGVMNRKSQSAEKMRKMSLQIFNDLELPRTPKGTYRGEDYHIDWDKFNPNGPKAVVDEYSKLNGLASFKEFTEREENTDKPYDERVEGYKEYIAGIQGKGKATKKEAEAALATITEEPTATLPDNGRGVTSEKPKNTIQDKIKKIENQELDDLWKEFLGPNKGDQLSASIVPVDPVKLAQGIKLIAKYTELGVLKFADIVNEAYARFGDAVKDMLPALKQAYSSFVSTAPDDMVDKLSTMQEVRSFLFENSDVAPVVKPAQPKKEPTGNKFEDLANAIVERLENGEGFGNTRQLNQFAKEILGEGAAAGNFDFKNLYDAQELAVNKYFIKNFPKGEGLSIEEINKVMRLLPTETERSVEQVKMQQYSTPPSYGYVVADVANIGPDDVVEEPSAGVGNIATQAYLRNPKRTIVNELSASRFALLKQLPFDRVENINAEHIGLKGNALDNEKPTVVVMNPPFSMNANLPNSKDLLTAGKHIQAAMNSLVDGGRLVAIVGGGMDFYAPKYSKWWAEMNRKYTIKANVLVAGEAYKQKGTVFDNRLVVIDKVAPKELTGIEKLATKTNFSDIIVTGKANSFNELLKMLEGVKNDRPRIQQSAASTGSEEISSNSKPSAGTRQPLYPAIDAIRGGTGSDRGNQRPSTGNAESVQPGSGNVSNEDNGIVGGGNTGRGSIERIANSGKSVRGGRNADFANEVRTAEPLEVVQFGKKASTEELTDAVFDSYQPQITIKGALPHPAEIVESAAMAAVSLPPVSYQPTLPQELITSGALSDAQLENIILAGNSHKQLIPNGERRGYFIGDGTGFGKGRQISAIILDNFIQGRKKAVWFSASSSLYTDAIRDWVDIGGDAKQIFPMAKIKTERPIEQPEGILFVGYGTLRSKFSDYEEARKGTKAKKEGVPLTDKTRIEQIAKWLGEDFDGVIAFDESHKMGNVLEMEIDAGGGRKQKKKPSQTAGAGVELQRLLPKARIVYVSATGATEVMNLAYANRLGLWGENTPFENVRNFVSSIADSGISAMEIIAKDLKALGLYLARSISFKGVEYRTLEHQLNPAQGEIYDKAAKAWQIVLKDINKAVKDNKTSKGAKAAALSAFWGTQQRFFQQLLLSLQIPSVLDDIRTQMDKGNAPVIQLVSTNEAATTREIDKQLGEKQFAKVREVEGLWEVYQPADKEEEDSEPVVLATYNTQADAKAHLEEMNNIDFDALDISPKDMLLEYIRNSFPVNQYEFKIDPISGNTVSVLVVGSDGQPLQNPESIKKRDALIAKLNDDLRVPKGALDILIDEFGIADIAEVTGRSKRIVPDKDGTYKLERRSPDAALTDAKDFQDDKKKILVFSDKGGTGASYHADLRKANQKRRTHYVFQAGWRADNAIQGFGRTHRSNQASKPEYVLVTTNLKAQKRFLSSIARRLDQLGALTKGTRKADTSIISSESNLETPQSAAAIRMLVNDIYNKKIPNMPVSRFEEETGLRVTNEESGQLLDDRMPSIKQFLNRMLSLTRESQDIIFDNFILRLNQAIEVDKQLGKYDLGMEDVHADKIIVKNRQVVFTEESTNAETELVELELTVPADKISWQDLQDKIAMHGKKSLITYAKYEKTNKPFAVITGNTSLDASGQLRETVIFIAPHGARYVSKNSYMANENLVRDIPAAEFKKQYIAEHDALPDVKTVSMHMITGLTLPLWSKIEGWPIIKRAQTNTGERLIGRVIPEHVLIQTMRNIGADGFAVGFDSEEVFNKLLETPGAHAVLANGWKLSRKSVQGEMRIELTNVKKKDYTKLEKNGVVMRVVNAMFDEREFYVPSVAVLNKIIKAFDSQITDAQYGNNDAAFSRVGLNDVTETEAFKEWFGDSKVVDENRKPMVVYHTTVGNFDKFSKQKNIGKSIGWHFGTIGQAGEVQRTMSLEAPFKDGANTMPVYLSLQNPIRLKDEGTWGVHPIISGLRKYSKLNNGVEKLTASNDWTKLKDVQRLNKLREFLQSNGYDGIVYENEYEHAGVIDEKIKKYDGRLSKEEQTKAHEKELQLRHDGRGIDSYIVFEPSQVKSATGNNGEFDAGNPDIRFSRVGLENEAAEFDRQAEELGIVFNGFQEQRNGKAPMPLFTDNKEFTGTTFVKRENETVEEALQRKRKDFGFSRVGLSNDEWRERFGNYSPSEVAAFQDLIDKTDLRKLQREALLAGHPSTVEYIASEIIIGKERADWNRQDYISWRLELIDRGIYDPNDKKNYGQETAERDLYPEDFPYESNIPGSGIRYPHTKAYKGPLPGEENITLAEYLHRYGKEGKPSFSRRGFYGIDNLGGSDARTGQVETNRGSVANDDGFGNSQNDFNSATDRNNISERRIEENRRADAGIRRSIQLSPYEQAAYARLINNDVVKNNPITVVGRAADIDTPQARLSNDLAQLFTGNDLLITKPDGKKSFAGVNVNGHIFIDQTELAPLFIVGHELMEQVYAKDKELFNKLSDVFASEVKNSEALKNYYADKIGKEFFDFYEQRGEVRKEIIADYMGQQMFNPEFWKRLNAKDEGLFRRLITKFKMFIQQLADYARMKRLRDVEQFLNDKERVLDELVDTVSDFVGKQNGDVFEPFGYARNTFGSQQWYYSQMEKVLTEQLPNSGTVPQMRNTIEAFLNNGKFKRDEYEWSGMPVLLDRMEDIVGDKEKVTKEQVLKMVRDNNVKLEEVVKGNSGEFWSLADGERLRKLLRENDNLGFDSPSEAMFAIMDHPDWTDRWDVKDRPELMELGEKYRTSKDANTKYSHYQLPGGENYKEMLLTLPAKEFVAPKAEVDKYFVVTTKEYPFSGQRDIEVKDKKTNETLSWRYGAYGTDEEIIVHHIMSEIVQARNDHRKENTFKSNHFEEPNVLMHVRFNERTIESEKAGLFNRLFDQYSKTENEVEREQLKKQIDAIADDYTNKDKRIVFMEEVQSDWHQKGRKEGYASNSELTRDEAKKLGYSIYRDKSNLGTDAYFMEGPNTPALGYDTEEEAWKELQSFIKLKKNNAVPNAPFKTNWQEVAFRRMVRYAAENGFDGVGWTTGEQQAERYDLSKQVDTVEYWKTNDGNFSINVRKEHNQILGKNSLTEVELENYLGKDITKKIVENAKPFNAKNPQILSGLDLKVGGNGMKGFYDAILVSYANKFGKKFGAKVEDVKVPISEDMGNYDDNMAGGKFDVPTAVHYLPVTDLMREAALGEGFPLFSRTGNDIGFSLMSAVEADEAERRVDAMLVDRSDLYEGKDRLNYKDPNIFTRPSVVLERYKPSLRNSVDRIHAQEAFMHEAVYIESRKMIDDVKKIIRGSMPSKADRSGWDKLDFIWRIHEYKELDQFLDISVPLAAHLNATAGDAGSWIFAPFEMRAGMLSIKQLKEMQKQFPSIKQGDEIEVVNPLVTQARAINAANAMKLKGKERIKFIVEYAENNPYTDIRKIGEEIKDSKGNPVFQLTRIVDAETQQLLYDRYSEKYPMFIHLIDNFIDPALEGSRKTVNGVEVPVFNRFSLADFMKENDPQFEALTAYTPDVFVNKSIIGAMQMLARRIMGGGTSPGRKYKSGQARETGNVVDIVRGFQTRAFQVLRENARKQFVREVIAMAEPMTINEEIPDNWVELNRGISQIYDAIRAVRKMNLKPYTRKMSEQEMQKYSETVRPDGRSGGVEDLPPNVVSVDLNAGTITIQPYYETKQRLSDKAENEDMDFFHFFQEARMMKSDRYKLPKRVVEVAINYYATQKMQDGLLRKINKLAQESALSLIVHPGTFVINYNTNKLFTLEAIGRKTFAGILKLPLSIFNTDFVQGKIEKAAEAAADAEKLEQGSYARTSFIQQYKDKYTVDAGKDFEMIKQVAAASVQGAFLGVQQRIGTDFAKQAEELIPGLMFKESTVFADISPDPFESARTKFERGDISGAMLTLFGYGNIDIKSKQRYAVSYLKAKVNRLADKQNLSGNDRTKFIDNYFKNIGINDRVEAMKAAEWEYLNYRDIPTALNNFQRKGWSRLFVPFIRFGYAYGIKQKDKIWDNGLRLVIDPKKNLDDRANGFANALWASMIDLGLAGILYGAFGGGDDDDDARKNIGTSQTIVKKSDGTLGKKTLDSELNTANRLNISRRAPDWFNGWLHQTGIIKADEDAWVRLRNYPMLYVPMLGILAGDDMKRHGVAEGVRTYLNGMMDLVTDFFNLGIGFTLPSKAFQEVAGLNTNPLDKYSSNIPLISYTTDNMLSSFIPFGRQADEVVLMLDPVPRRLTESKKLGYNLTPFEQMKNGFLIGHIPGIFNRLFGYGGNFPSQGKIEDVSLLKREGETRDDFEKRINALNLLDTPQANEYTDFRKGKNGEVKETERIGFVQPPENKKYKYGQNILRMFGGLNVKGVNRERYDEAINNEEE